MTARAHPGRLALLGLPALLYAGAMRLRNRFYDLPGASRRAAVPVISVGNLTLGGTGKTPLVAWLASHLRADGLKPAVVSRGYGGRPGREPLLVSAGEGPLCEAEQSGDEPYLHARSLPGVVVVVGTDRVAAAARAVGEGVDAVLLDDGFQHRRLCRDLDIVLLDATNPLDNLFVLPAGRLREPPAGLRRAGVVVITRARPGESFPEIERMVRRHNAAAPIVTAGHEVTGFVGPGGEPAEAPARVVAFCGIGNPDLFRADLESSGVELVELKTYRDHHAFTTAELNGLARLAADREAALVTTEKDLVRAAPRGPRDPAGRLLALRIRTVVHAPRRLMEAVDRALGRGSV